MNVSTRSQKAIAFLEQLHPNDKWNITTIPIHGKELKSCSGDAKDHVQLAKFLDENIGVKNIYYNVNPLLKISTKAKKEDVKSIAYLQADLDPRAGEDIQQERKRILHVLENPPEDVPKPTYIIDSGGGYQALWKLTEAVIVNGDIKAIEEIERYTITLETRLGADSCHNADRILRLPFTVNLPNANKRKKGRVEAPTSIVNYDPHAIYNLEKAFKQSAPIQSVDRSLLNGGKEEAKVQINHNALAKIESIDDLDEWGVPERIKVIAVQGNDPDKPKQGDDSRSAWLFDFCCGLVRCGVPDEVIYPIIINPAFKISESVLDKKSSSSMYALRQIKRAHDVSTDFVCNKDGKPFKQNQKNIRIALSRLDKEILFDEFSNRMLVNGKRLNESDAIGLYLQIERQFGFLPTKEYFWMVLEDYARENSFHPIRDYLDGLSWDEKPRIDTWLSVYGGAEDTSYVRGISKIMLIAAARRIRNPGVKFDEMVVLESTQGKYKSTALSILAVNPDWFTDDLLLSADTKRQIESIEGRWIVEAGELKGMRKTDVEHLKSFLSRTVDRARLSYDRLVTEIPRQCIVIGTTNSESYLRDGTGNRRFWPVKVKGFDIIALKKDIHQLWAEAAHREQMGESIRLDKSLWKDAAQEQKKRHVEDPYFTSLESAIGRQNGKIRKITAWNFVGVPIGQKTQDDQARLNEAMRALDFELVKLRFGGKPEYCYARGDKNERKTEIRCSIELQNVSVNHF